MSKYLSQGQPITIITSRGDPSGVSFTTLFSRWELTKALAMRSIRSRFRGTRLGIVWALVQPLFYMAVLNLFFGLIARFDSGDIPYPLYLLTGLVAFQLFTKSISEGAGSISGNQGILSKIYIPPIVFPAASTISGLIDFVFPAILLVIFLVIYQVQPTLNLLFLPVPLFFLVLLCSSAHLFMSVVAVRFQDVRMVVPIVTQLLFFGTPIFYSVALIPESYRALFGLNPMVGIIEALRWSLLGSAELPHLGLILTSAAVTLLGSLVSVLTFRGLGRNLYNYVG